MSFPQSMKSFRNHLLRIPVAIKVDVHAIILTHDDSPFFQKFQRLTPVNWTWRDAIVLGFRPVFRPDDRCLALKPHALDVSVAVPSRELLQRTVEIHCMFVDKTAVVSKLSPMEAVDSSFTAADAKQLGHHLQTKQSLHFMLLSVM